VPILLGGAGACVWVRVDLLPEIERVSDGRGRVEEE